MKISRSLLCIFLICGSITGARSQENSVKDYPVIGQKCPELTFKNIQYYSKKEAGLKDFAGKPLIIDFFSRGCASCFASFPKINELKKKYKDQVEILLVGLVSNAESLRKTKEIYDVYSRKYDLQIPITYDSVIGDRFKIDGVPHVVFVNKEGIVEAVTYTVEEKLLMPFINGEYFDFEDVSYDNRQIQAGKIDIELPLHTNGNGGPDTPFIQRSLLSKWNKQTPRTVSDDGFLILDIGVMDYVPYVRSGPLQLTGTRLKDLFRMAYLGTAYGWYPDDRSRYGVYHQHPILELKDSSLFADDNLYNYSLITSPARNKDKQHIMQNDMENFFGYSAKIETRKMPCLKLICTEKGKQILSTKGDSMKFKPSSNGFMGQNVSVANLIYGIDYTPLLGFKGLPLIDETGIKGNIDIQFKAVMTDLDDVRRAIKPFGLDIVQSEKEMKCLVIRDGHN